MGDVLVCVDGVWSVSSGLVACDGTSIESVEFSDTMSAVNQEFFDAFWPWALMMFAIAFGIRMIRRTILTRS